MRPGRLAIRIWLLAVAVALATLAGVSGSAAGAALPPVKPVVLPRDHGAHPGFQVEWWYTAGTVAPAKGHRYFWFATIWSSGPGIVARLNVVDLHTDRIVLAHQYLVTTPTHAGQTRFQVQGFRLGWRRGAQPRGSWSLDATTPAGRLTLSLTPRAAYIMHGHHGVIQQGPGGLSAYYSEPRLQARGALVLNGQRIALNGLGWLDHQWGNFIGNRSSLRWNWFACQFADGRDLMLYQFLNAHDQPAGYQAGTLVSSAGVTHLDRFSVTGMLPSVHPSGAQATYPLRWRLDVPALGTHFTVRSLARNQFIHMVFLPSFWETATTITRGPAGSCIVESSREV